MSYSLTLDVMFNRSSPEDIELLGANGRALKFKTRSTLPSIFRYQRAELLTLIDNSSEQDLRISKRILRWVARDVLKHPKFLVKSLTKTKRLKIEEISIQDLPITVTSKEKNLKIWVSRHSIKFGVTPSNLDESLEYDRLRNPDQFDLLIRFANNDINPQDYNLYRGQSYDFYFAEHVDEEVFGIDYEKIKNAEVLHGRIALSGEKILQISNLRKEIIRREPRYIDTAKNEIRVLNSFFEHPFLSEAIFIGSNLNWFHFIVECLTRYVAIPEVRGLPIILERGVHKNIVEICRILTKIDPILVGPLESVSIGDLYLGREFGIKDAIDSTPRNHLLLELRAMVLKELVIEEPAKTLKKNLYFRRKSFLFRPLQNEIEIEKTLVKLDFISIYPEDLGLFELIALLQNSSTVVVESGAAMTNLMFAPKGLKVIELNPGDGGYGFWESFLEPFELFHSGLVGQRQNIGKKGFASDGFRINVKTLLQIIDN
jgi:hypothetical protein